MVRTGSPYQQFQSCRILQDASHLFLGHFLVVKNHSPEGFSCLISCGVEVASRVCPTAVQLRWVNSPRLLSVEDLGCICFAEESLLDLRKSDI